MAMFRYYLALARKNLFRNKRRTIITFLALAVGLWYFILLDSILQGFDRQSIDNFINLETSHLRLHAAGYWEKREDLPLDHLLYNVDKIMAQVRQTPDVQATTPRLIFSAQVNNGVDELPVMGAGIDSATDPAVFPLPKYLVEGSYLKPGENGALLGKELAELMDLKQGDIFTLIMRSESGAMQAIDLAVTGVLETPHPEVNNGLVYLPLDVAQKALNTAGGVSEIDIRAAGTKVVDSLKGKLEGIQGAGIYAYTWRDMARDFLQMSEAERGYDLIMLVMVFVIALVGVVNTVLLATLERTREIGMLKAMGMTGREILFLFIAEAGYLGVLGGVAGVVLSVATEFYLVNTGLDYSALLKDVNIGYPVAGILYGEWNLPIMALAFFFGIAVCVAASILPARRAAGMDAARALRGA